MHDNELVAMVVVLPSAFCAAAFLVWSVGNNIRRSRVSRAMVEMQTRLIEKLPPEELPAYANSEAGKAILTLDAGRTGSPRDRILNTLTAGFVTGFVGIALFAVHRMQSNEEAREALYAAGALGMATGLGLLLSAAVSYKLIQSWGLLEGKK